MKKEKWDELLRKRRHPQTEDAAKLVDSLESSKGAVPLKEPEGVTEPLETVTGPLHLEKRKALAVRLTEEIKQDFRNAIVKLRQVHAEKLWEPLGYSGFEEYVQIEFGKTRKWGYQQLTLLKAAESLEARGVKEPLRTLSKEAALVFRRWENRPEVFYLAYQQIIERGEEPTQERLEQDAAVQADYLQEADRIPELTQEEYRAYLKLKHLPSSFELDKTFESADKLLDECRSKKKRPPLKALVHVARGNDLLALVQQLEPLSAEVAKLDALKKEKTELERQKRDQAQALTDKIRQLADDIAKAEGEKKDDKQADADDDDDDEQADADDDNDEQADADDDDEQADADDDKAPQNKTTPTTFDGVKAMEDAVAKLEEVAKPENLAQWKDKKAELTPLLTRAMTALDTLKLAVSSEEEDVKPVP